MCKNIPCLCGLNAVLANVHELLEVSSNLTAPTILFPKQDGDRLWHHFNSEELVSVRAGKDAQFEPHEFHTSIQGHDRFPYSQRAGVAPVNEVNGGLQAIAEAGIVRAAR